MVAEISGDSVSNAYIDGIWQLRVSAVEDDSRNGPVITIPRPTVLSIYHPWKRVLIDEVRQPNPYFHIAEFVWMMAGSNDAEWLSYYNSRYMEYAEPDGLVHGAYGHRWFEHFGVDQVAEVLQLLAMDDKTRRAAIGMWDPCVDLQDKRDLPCNTHIYFRMQEGTKGQKRLDMTVCNRSNDYFWGMMGANVVHMTLLQEFLANALGWEMGVYRVFTNNLHVYKSIPRYQDLMDTMVIAKCPYGGDYKHIPLLADGQDPMDFIIDCRAFVHSGQQAYRHTYYSPWFTDTFIPMMKAYDARKRKEDETPWLNQVRASDWKMAGFAWKEWKDADRAG
jgi:hypothetical protein